MRDLFKIMRNLFTISVIVFMFATVFVDWTEGRKTAKLHHEVQTLATNNVHLMRMNALLTKGMEEVARVQLEQAEFDRNVATNMQQLRENTQLLRQNMQLIYGLNRVRTNPVSGTIP